MKSNNRKNDFETGADESYCHDQGPFGPRPLYLHGVDGLPLSAELLWHEEPAPGSTVILISPGICSIRELYRPLGLTLAARRPVYIHDHRCHNGNGGEFDVSLAADDLGEIIRSLNSRGLKTVVVGHSFGGMLAGIAVARGAPAFAQVLLATPPSLTETCRKVPRSIGPIGLYLYNLGRAVKSSHYRRILAGMGKLTPWGFFADPTLLSLKPGPGQAWDDLLEKIHEAPGIAEYATAIRESGVPTKFIWGSMDGTHGLRQNRGMLPDHFKAYVDRIVVGNPLGEVKILPGLSHYLTFSQKSAVPVAGDNGLASGEIGAFIEKISPRPFD